MLCAGDEMGRSQRGNNNAYCQDNELSWLNWDLSVDSESLLEFACELIQVRKKHLVFRRDSFTNCLFPHKGNPIHWYRPNGCHMSAKDWHNGFTRCMGLMLLGDNLQEYDKKSRRLVDDTFMYLLNAHWEPISFVLPSGLNQSPWRVLFDTSKDPRDVKKPLVRPLKPYIIKPRSLVLLVQPLEQPEKNKEAVPELLSQLVYIPRPSKPFQPPAYMAPSR